jgi:enoyl-CoA hydratase
VGLVNKVVPKEHLMDEAVDWARTICNMAPRAARNFHEMIFRCWNMSIPEAQAYASAREYNLRGMEDSKEGPRAFAEKRRANFQNR